MNFVKCTNLDGTTVFINLDHVESIFVTKKECTRVCTANYEAYWEVKEPPDGIIEAAKDSQP